MKLWSRLSLAAAGLAVLWIGFGLVDGAAAQGRGATPAGRTAGEAFANVTTSTLKDLSVDDFIATMGVISAALGYDCSDCHPGAGTDKVDFAIDSYPRKRTARRMIEMVADINRSYFGNIQRVTCWTCHHSSEIPATSIALDNLYSSPMMEDSDIVPPSVEKITADQILDKYIEALGGAQRLAGLQSYVATGASEGYGSFGGDAEFTIYAQSPNRRTTRIVFPDHPERGESVWSFDGNTGWIKTPHGFLEEFQLVGGELDGARIEAQLSFPGQIKQLLNNWRVGLRRTIENRDYYVVQGRGPRGLLVTFYFDPQTGLLRRLVRYSPSPVGRVPIQIDYSDYRDVNGIKFPFGYQFSWLDGRYSATIKEVRTNVPVDASRFGRPTGK